MKDNSSSDEKEQNSKKNDSRLLTEDQSKHAMDLIDKRNIYDYVLSLDKLSKVQKARILSMTLTGVYSNIQMYFVARLFELLT